MRVTKLKIAFLSVALFGAAAAGAQNLQNAGAPAEIPPLSFSGKQYVDSTGCVFVRAGFDGNVVWVPRVSRDRRQLCGFEPSLAGAPADVAAPLAAPAVRELITLVPDGGTSAPSAPAVHIAPAPVALASAPTPGLGAPGGFKVAWSDDRLNAQRGPRTDAGDAAMARVWTDTVPRKLRADRGGRDAAPRAVLIVDQAPMSLDQKAQALADKFSGSITQSSKSPEAAGVQARFVQVATFADDANARALAARLGALGLPVTIRTTGRGGGLQVVLAGPFGSRVQAQKALEQARSSGFSDAYLRR